MKACKTKIFRELTALHDWHQYTRDWLAYEPMEDQREFNIHIRDQGSHGAARSMELCLHSLVDTEVECGAALTWSIDVYTAADVMQAVAKLERAYNLFRQNWKTA